MRFLNPMRVFSVMILGGLTSLCSAESKCFRSMADAAAQSGTQSSDGFRFEALRFDPFLHASWATVRSCAHPERPGFVVLQASASASSTQRISASAAEPQPENPVMRAGKQVRFVLYEEALRLEVPGVAQANAAVGGQVKVRLNGLGDGAEGRFAVGIVRNADLVEAVR